MKNLKKNSIIKYLLFALFGIPYMSFSKNIKEDITNTEPIYTPNGKKVKLIREYPLKEAHVTPNKEYDVVEEYSVNKKVTQTASIPINIIEILNDKNECVRVSPVFFEYI